MQDSQNQKHRDESGSADTTTEAEVATAIQQEKLTREIEKLVAETESLKSSSRWEKRFGRYLPFLAVLAASVPGLVAIGAFLFGVYQVGEQQQFTIKSSEKEFRRRFYEKQLDTYFDVSKTVGQISAVEDPREVDKLHAHFLELYNGSLIMVQDAEVKGAAKTFETSFSDYTSGRLNRDQLQARARRVVRACRNSLLGIWDIKSLNRDDDFVNIRESDLNCLFSPACTVTFSDTTDNFTLSTGGTGFLQSRTYTGSADSSAPGLYAYEYRVDLRNAAGPTTISCIDWMSIDLGPVVETFDYNKDDDPDRIFVVNLESVGTIGIGSAVQTGSNLRVSFRTPICEGGAPGNGDSSFFWGLVSKAPPKIVTATLHETGGASHVIEARSPQ
jgi:hypothetical protein